MIPKLLTVTCCITHGLAASTQFAEPVALLQSQKFQGSDHKGVNKCQWPILPFEPSHGATSNCPSRVWIDEMVKDDPAPGKQFVSVGCNKGDDIIELMERWDPSGHVWSKSSWVEELNRTGIEYHACVPDADGFSKAAGHAEKHSGWPLGVCVEPMPANVRLLRRVYSTLFPNKKLGKHHMKFHIEHVAVSDSFTLKQTNGFVQFPDGAPGTETAALENQAPFAMTVPVKLSTLDQIVEKYALSQVDILMIDTEGQDPAVLDGGLGSLTKVRYLEFEVHRDLADTPWGKTSLSSVVSRLDDMGFSCYWAGNNGQLINIIDCWQESFEKTGWSNAACVKRGDRWFKVLEKFAAPLR